MMRLPEFKLRQPRTIAEALAIRAGEGDHARFVAGGTDLYPNMKRRHQNATTLVSLRRVSGLVGISADPSCGVSIGAMTTLAAIASNAMLRQSYPGFVRAVASISAPSLRHMGTIGGNLCLDTRCTYYDQNEEWREAIDNCMKCEGSICWVAPSSPRCWAISAADSVPVLCALGAKVKISGPHGERTIPLSDLYRDDGIRYLTLEPNELLTTLELPAPGAVRSTYWKLRRRGSIDFPVLGVGASFSVANGTVTAAKVVLGAVASAPLEVAKAAEILVGHAASEEAIATVAKAARALATPLDNTDFAMQWRAKMVETYVDGALRELAGLPARTKAPTHGAWALAT
jgi:4-hydroxybenzoyl-CoA reductase subunit beta